MDDRKVKLDK